MLKAVLAANMVTVSTPTLCEYLQPLNPSISILPNYLNDDIWELSEPQIKVDNSPIVIGYMGGDSHIPDIESVEPALGKILEQYPDRVTFRFLGVKPPPSLSGVEN